MRYDYFQTRCMLTCLRQVTGVIVFMASTCITRPVRPFNPCHLTAGIDGIIDWEYLQGIDSTWKGSISSYLKGNLLSNASVTNYLRAELFESVAFSYTHMLEQIHDLRVAPYDDWEKQDWLCSNCIVNILQAHLHLWLLFRMKQCRFLDIIRAAQR